MFVRASVQALADLEEMADGTHVRVLIDSHTRMHAKEFYEQI